MDFPDRKKIKSLCLPTMRKNLDEILSEGDDKLNLKVYQPYWDSLKKIEFLEKEKSILKTVKGRVRVGAPLPEKESLLDEVLFQMKPWRKGPVDWYGMDLDTEWDSSLKWERLASHIDPLWGKAVLDVGCNNGYYLLKMLEQDPAYALGIDPTPRFYLQWLMLTKGLGLKRAEFQLLGIEHLNFFPQRFDSIFCMGILYHHPDPMGQLKLLKNSLKPGGQLILEGMGIDAKDPVCLFPETRYAKAPGVWFLPSLSCMVNWVKRAGFKDVEVVDSRKTTSEEQRNSKYCPRPFETLKDFLNPENEDETVEGYPAPWRHMVVARC